MNIHFDHKPATASTVECWNVYCDGKPFGFIHCNGAGWCYQTESFNAYARRKNRTSRRARLCESLDDAKAAAVAYVTRKLKQASDEQPVQHGCGEYRKYGPRWYYTYLDDAGQPLCSPQPAASKKQAIERLKAVPLWVKADVVEGVVRWKVNGSVPPADCRERLRAEGVQFDEAKSAAADKADFEALVAEYRSRPRDDSPEAQFERRAAFGAGQVIVDVISGHRYET